MHVLMIFLLALITTMSYSPYVTAKGIARAKGESELNTEEPGVASEECILCANCGVCVASCQQCPLCEIAPYFQAMGIAFNIDMEMCAELCKDGECRNSCEEECRDCPDPSP